ncbi:MAG: hypothetical protein ACYTGG_12330 [Planctomycetota bacterium]|jgi:hypothetical protein
MLEWIQEHEAIVWWLAAASVVTFVGTLIAVPMLVIRIPADYFAHRRRHTAPWADQHPAIRVCLLIGKNTLGVVFIAVGLAMFVLPGQGILTVMIGLMLLDFPGKFALERWLVSHRPVSRAIAWLRRRAHREPLRLPRMLPDDSD